MRIDISMHGDALGELMSLRQNLVGTMEIGVRRTLVFAADEVPRHIKPGMELTPRSGGLGKSWTPRGGAVIAVHNTDAISDGSLGSNHPAARIQNEGGYVVPRKARALAIPLDAAKTAAGVARWSSPRKAGDLDLIKIHGKAFLVRKSYKGATATAIVDGRVRRVRKSGKAVPAKLEFLFVLKDEVFIPPSEYLDSAARVVETKAPAIMATALQQAIDRGGKAGRSE